ncbi:MAG: efflux RND transporter periplasmic adaptor subunit [Clostridia bacterium]|nr:efflux RND transporter periplasmic adaptor subunit [Clostridia bacterium]
MSEKIDIDNELTEGKKEILKKKPKPAVLAAGGVVALILIIWGISAIVNSVSYLKTDNAKVLTDIYPITTKAEGKLIRFDAYKGQYIESGTIIGRVDNGPYIKAQGTGEIISVNAECGDYATVTDVLGYIADIENAHIGAYIEETDIVKIALGQFVDVTLDAYGGKHFDGVVTKINNITDNALSGQTTSYSTSGTYTKTTQLIPIEITIDNSDGKLDNIIGTNATVRIKVR